MFNRKWTDTLSLPGCHFHHLIGKDVSIYILPSEAVTGSNVKLADLAVCRIFTKIWNKSVSPISNYILFKKIVIKMGDIIKKIKGDEQKKLYIYIPNV